MSSLTKKLLIKPNQTWLFLNAPENYLPELEPLPENVKAVFSLDIQEQFDGIQIFVKNSSELKESLKLIKSNLKPATVLWIAYPKKSSGMESDLTMTGKWDMPERFSFGPVAAASINEIWTGIRLKPLGTSKISEVCNDQIKQNDFSAFVDVGKKLVTLPPDLQEALEQRPAAITFYEQLSYSNKKEYVLWVLTAKQEKTRTDRINKTVEKLLAKKKNPSEK